MNVSFTFTRCLPLREFLRLLSIRVVVLIFLSRHTPRSLEFTIWFVPNLIGNAVAVSFVGLLLGPFYPIAMNVISGLLPRW